MKKFLSAFAGIAAAFVSDANATVAPSKVSTPLEGKSFVSQAVPLPSQNVTVRDSKGDQFDFVLKKSSDTGQMMAYHNSHSSHSSHSSHYSSRW